jgi:hypothetical protein
MTHYQFQSEADQPLVRFHNRGLLRLEAEVEATPEALGLPELPLLVLFGWYLVVMLYKDSAAVSATVAAT